jgi:zinc transport system substrate-binding protein
MIRTLALICLPLPAFAEVKVVTDIAPIHSLTQMIMGDTGKAHLLLPPGANAHHFQFRPSDGQVLQDADVVVMVGPALTPWLADPVDTLASSAMVLTLAETEGWTKREMRSEGGHEDHGDDHKDHDDHGHEDHDDHKEEGEDHAGHDDHDHEDHAEHDDHGHDADHAEGNIDPHGWLDPDTARVWAAEIGNQLSEADPDNAATYAANLETVQAMTQDLEQQITDILSDAGPIIWPHDGYQYFEARFKLDAHGSISDAHAATPGPARIGELQEIIADDGITCVLTDAEINGDWVNLVIEGSDAGTAFIDSLGADLEPGSDLYPAMMLKLARAIADC